VCVCACTYLRTVVAYLSPSAGRAVHNHNGHGQRSSSSTGHGPVRGGLTRATCGSDHDQMLVLPWKMVELWGCNMISPANMGDSWGLNNQTFWIYGSFYHQILKKWWLATRRVKLILVLPTCPFYVPCLWGIGITIQCGWRWVCYLLDGWTRVEHTVNFGTSLEFLNIARVSLLPFLGKLNFDVPLIWGCLLQKAFLW